MPSATHKIAVAPEGILEGYVVNEIIAVKGHIMSIAEQMGYTLQNTALSVNVKERLDFSCAVLDADGFLVANAPHVPVHLGALGVCARTILSALPPLQPGDVVVDATFGAGGYTRALLDAGVVGSFRKPNALRFGLGSLYLRYEDIWETVQRLRRILEAESWRDDRFQKVSV